MDKTKSFQRVKPVKLSNKEFNIIIEAVNTYSGNNKIHDFPSIKGQLLQKLNAFVLPAVVAVCDDKTLSICLEVNKI